jgi:hypothetical protein
MLLGAVVEIALQPAPFGVLCLDETLSGGLELPGADQQFRTTVVELSSQPDPFQHQARLGSETGEESFLDEGQGQAGAFLEPQHP